MTKKRKAALALAAGSCLAMVITGVAWATHPRPQGAKTIRVVFVPAFKPCTSATPLGNKHGAPLSFDSCSPPGPDTRTNPPPTAANGGGPAPGAAHGHAHVTIPVEDTTKARGSAFIDVRCYDPTHPSLTDPAHWNTETPPCNPTPGDNMDVFVSATATDVRCSGAATEAIWAHGGSLCDASANTAPSTDDYKGKLLGNSLIRITDHYNGGPTFSTAGTVVDTNFPIGTSCSATTTDATRGGACAVSTSANSIVPGVVLENKRANVEIPAINVYEPGANGSLTAGTIVPVPSPICPPVCNFDTPSDEQLFATQGIFIP